METFSSGDLHIDVSRPQALTVRLDWRGKSTERDPDTVIAPFIHEIAQQVSTSGAAVEMHFEAMEYFNSSTIASLVKGIRLLSSQGTALKVIYSGKIAWQRKSFEALRILRDGHDSLVFEEI